jgi:hypothetical protein
MACLKDTSEAGTDRQAGSPGIGAGLTGAESELCSLRKEAGYFRDAFGRELFATVA